jgi:flavodoxin
MRRLKIFKRILLFWCFFIGLGAIWGGAAMLIKPDGSILHMQELLPYFKVLPFADVLFTDYVFSGIMLILVNGVSNIIAAVLILRNKKAGFVLGTVFGFTLMLWITIQFIIFPPNFLDNAYFTFGVLQLISGYIALVSFNQVHFVFDEKDYPDVVTGSSGADAKTLVVYFSRMNYTKRIAYNEANIQKAKIVELKTNERTQGTLGFWWCGRFGMHKWGMETLPLEVKLSDFEKIIIVTPIWVFKMCASVRDFVSKNKDVLKQKNVEVVFNHFNPWLPKGAIKEIESYIDVAKISSYTTMQGHTFNFPKDTSCSSQHVKNPL